MQITQAGDCREADIGERRDGPRAIRFYLQALRLGDAIRAPAEQRAVTSSSLAYAHLLRGDLEPAVEEAERALERAALGRRVLRICRKVALFSSQFAVAAIRSSLLGK